MKWLWFSGGAAVVIVGGVAFFAFGIISKFHEEDRRLQEAYEQHALALRSLDNQLPKARHETLHPERFAVWLAVRAKVAKEYAARIEEPSPNTFHARETRNRVLGLLREELEKAGMGPTEYRSLSARWRALVGRAEFAALREAWKRTVFDAKHPQGEGLPLPPAAENATAGEIALVKANAERLEASMHADLLGPLLEEIADPPGAGK